MVKTTLEETNAVNCGPLAGMARFFYQIDWLRNEPPTDVPTSTRLVIRALSEVILH